MKSLPKKHQLSENYLTVRIEGEICKIYNLLVSGIMHQRIVILEYNDEYYEIDCIDQGGDNSNLQALKHFISSFKVTFELLNIPVKPKFKPKTVGLPEFQKLSELYPDYTPEDIGLLYKNLTRYSRRSCYDDLKGFLYQIDKKKQSISNYIEQSEIESNKLINMERTEQRINELQKIGLTPDADNSISTEDIETLSDRKFLSRMTDLNKQQSESGFTAIIPLSSIETIDVSKISELQNLKLKQEEIVKSNPFTPVTDKESLTIAKKHKAALLSASTSTEKIEKDASKYLNTIKSAIKKIVSPASQITRDAHQKQANEISRFENEEEMRKQAEQRAKLEKIENRTSKLFNAGFVFSGSVYTCGTIHVLPSQIESESDENFEAWIKQGEALTAAQKSKDDEIAELKKKLAALENVPDTPVSTPPPPAAPAPVKTVPPVVPAPSAPKPPVKYEYATEYTEPVEGNDMLVKFDLENVSVLNQKPIPAGFIKARSVYTRGAKDLATKIESIIVEESDNNALFLISELCNIIKSQN